MAALLAFAQLLRRFWPLLALSLCFALLVANVRAAEPPAPAASAAAPATVAPQPVGFAGCIRSGTACTCHDTRGRVMGSSPEYCNGLAGGDAGAPVNVANFLQRYISPPVVNSSFHLPVAPAKARPVYLGRFPLE